MSALGKLAGGIVSGIAGLIGSTQNRHAQEEANAANYAMQKEFAMNGIRWKVADAKAAGLHPLAALNAYTSSYQPSNTAFTSDLSEIGDKLGQNIDRAIEAKATAQERAEDRAYETATRDNNLVRQNLENDRLRNDIALQQAELSRMVMSTQQQVPGMPAAGPEGPFGQLGPNLDQVEKDLTISVDPDGKALFSPSQYGINRTEDKGWIMEKLAEAQALKFNLIATTRPVAGYVNVPGYGLKSVKSKIGRAYLDRLNARKAQVARDDAIHLGSGGVDNYFGYDD